MTIIQAIDKVDNLVPNMYLLGDKINWLSQLDAQITAEILDTHEPEPGTELIPFTPYNEETDQDKELIAHSPYDDIYLYYLEMQIHRYNSENDKYNYAATMFNEAYRSYRNYYNRYHMPKSARNIYY